MTDKTLIIFGAGSHGLVVAEAAVAAGWDVRGFRDDDVQTKTVGLWPVVDESALDARSEPVNVIVAVGNNEKRMQIAERLVRQGCRLVNVIHPTAWVSPSAFVARGVFIGAMAVVHVEAHINDGAIINTHAIVEHHCHIGSYVHIAPGVAMGGNCSIGSGTLIGVGARLRPQITIGDDCTIGAGAVIVCDIASGCTARGNPARSIAPRNG